jgi:hypothetical protein
MQVSKIASHGTAVSKITSFPTEVILEICFLSCQQNRADSNYQTSPELLPRTVLSITHHLARFVFIQVVELVMRSITQLGLLAGRKIIELFVYRTCT